MPWYSVTPKPYLRVEFHGRVVLKAPNERVAAKRALYRKHFWGGAIEKDPFFFVQVHELKPDSRLLRDVRRE